jgi:hypothetical protein
MVFVVTDKSTFDVGEIRDEFDGGDPLHLREAELEFVTKSQRCTVPEGECRVVHVTGGHGEPVAHLLDAVGVVAGAPVGVFAEGVRRPAIGTGGVAASHPKIVDMEIAPHLAMPGQPWMQKCWVICSG